MTREARLLFLCSACAALAAGAVALARPFAVEASFDVSMARPAFGWVTLALVILSALYSLRRRLFLQWPGELKVWKAVHVLIGLLSVVTMLLHSGGGAGEGLALLICGMMAAVALSGVWGVTAQGTVPRIMTATLQDPVYKSELQDNVAGLLGEISSGLARRSPRFQKVFQRHILPAISIDRPNIKSQNAFLLRYDPVSVDPNAASRDMGPLDDDERDIFYSMAEKTLDIIEIRRSQTYQRMMNQWLVWHIGLTALLLTMIFFHILASWYF